MPFSPSTQEVRQRLCELKASLVYSVISRTVRAMQREPVSMLLPQQPIKCVMVPPKHAVFILHIVKRTPASVSSSSFLFVTSQNQHYGSLLLLFKHIQNYPDTFFSTLVACLFLANEDQFLNSKVVNLV